MKVLAIECSSPKGSVALATDGAIQSSSWENKRSHNEHLLPAIDELLKGSGVNATEIDLIAVGEGPGRFTGIRIGINVARTLACLLNKPVFSISSLTVAAQNASLEEPSVLVMQNAFKNMVFYQLYENNGALFFPTTLPTAKDIGQMETDIPDGVLCVGDGYNAYRDMFSRTLIQKVRRDSKVSDYPTAEKLTEIAMSDLSLGRESDWTNVKPLYIRLSEAEERLRDRLLKPQ